MQDLLNKIYLGLALRGEEEEEGQGMVEYALIIALVAIVVIIALVILGPKVGNVLNYASNSLNK